MPVLISAYLRTMASCRSLPMEGHPQITSRVLNKSEGVPHDCARPAKVLSEEQALAADLQENDYDYVFCLQDSSGKSAALIFLCSTACII